MKEVEAFLLFVSELRTKENTFLSVDIYHDDICNEFVVRIDNTQNGYIYHFRNTKLSKSIGDAFAFFVEYDNNVGIKL
ncbi:MAG: hypothetical protein IIC75_06350 [Bacteroidetes bacterium]|nr:hypothetical protein [Bacteroidota bacterium]